MAKLLDPSGENSRIYGMVLHPESESVYEDSEASVGCDEEGFHPWDEAIVLVLANRGGYTERAGTFQIDREDLRFTTRSIRKVRLG